MNTCTDRQKACITDETLESLASSCGFYGARKAAVAYAREVLNLALETTSPMTGFSEPDGGAGDVRGETIYQLKLASGDWRDQSESSYRNNAQHAGNIVRIVYAAPSQSAALAGHDVIVSLLDDSPCSFDAAHAGATLTDEPQSFGIPLFEDMRRALEHVECVYRLNFVAEDESSSTLANLQRVIARIHAAGPTPVADSWATLTDEQRRTLFDLYRCFIAWEPQVRVLGDVRADDAANAVYAVLAPTPVADSGASKPVAYFVNDNQPGMKPHYSQISEAFKHHKDVFAFYTHPPIGDAAGKDSVDAARLDFMLAWGVWLTWSKDRECCRLFIRDEDGEAKPFLGWGPGKNFNTGRDAIDAAIAYLTKPATGDKP